jgi:hypothetical protein
MGLSRANVYSFIYLLIYLFIYIQKLRGTDPTPGLQLDIKIQGHQRQGGDDIY